MRWHPHIYMLVEDRTNIKIGGMMARKRVWVCRFCTARKTQMSGSMTR